MNSEGEKTKQNIPKGLSLVVSKKDNVNLDQQLSKDPNVGGFGQTDVEIVYKIQQQ